MTPERADSVMPLSEERRHEVRLRSVVEHGIVAVRVRPGIHANLQDICSGGAALETDRRLMPGRYIHVQFVRQAQVTTIRARVLRNDVGWLTAGLVVYRCAVQFDQRIQFHGGSSLIALAPPAGRA